MLAWLHDGGLIAITLAVIAFVLYLWWTNAPERVFARYGFALVIGGAIGNLIDRVMHGYVVDYVLFTCQHGLLQYSILQMHSSRLEQG